MEGNNTRSGDEAPLSWTDPILIAEDGRGVFLKASGHIRALDCYPLREELLSRLDCPKSPTAVFIELSDCRYMDSTFIGLLVAMDGRLKSHGGRLRVFNPSAECLESLGRLGLDRVLSVEHGPLELPPGSRPLPYRGSPGAEFVLKAHEALMEKSEEAKKKFSLLKEMLEKKLRKG
jgi:anti-anti-sigma factor